MKLPPRLIRIIRTIIFYPKNKMVQRMKFKLRFMTLQNMSIKLLRKWVNLVKTANLVKSLENKIKFKPD